MKLSTTLLTTLACTYALEIQAATNTNAGMDDREYDGMHSSTAELHDGSDGIGDAPESLRDLALDSQEFPNKEIDMSGVTSKETLRTNNLLGNQG